MQIRFSSSRENEAIFIYMDEKKAERKTYRIYTKPKRDDAGNVSG